MKKWKIYFVPHTHWDKEWYFTKDASEVFLIDNIHKLRSIIENKEEFFGMVYDGQLSIVDDYLSFYPHDESFIKEMIKNKKLIVGPWYTQTDTFNTTGESIVRNLLIGKLGAENLGHSQSVGYLPDSFGFNSNLPQILSKAECPFIFQWRGVCSEILDGSLYNLWKGIDGTTIPLYNFFKPGYGMTIWAFAESYKKWEKAPMHELAKIYLDKFKSDFKDLDNWKKMNPKTNNQICFPFGSDQFPIISGVPDFIENLNKLDEENEWILSTYDNFAKQITSSVDNKSLHIMEGELKYGQYSRTHRTIASSRVDIKQASKNLEYMIYREAEPMALLYSHFGGEYPSAVFSVATKRLLESHAHDSLGGSCTDITNQQILDRLSGASSMIESQLTMMKRRICESIGLEKNDIIIFNNLIYKRNIEFICDIYTRNQFFKILNDSGKEISFDIVEQEFRDYINFTTLYDTHLDCKIENINNKGHFKTTVKFYVDKFNGLGYLIYKVIDEPTDCFGLSVAKNLIAENDYFKLQLLNDGSISIFDKNNKSKPVNNLSLEAMQDAGDTYDYSPPLERLNKMNILLEQNCKIVKQANAVAMIISQTYSVPKSLDNLDKIEQKIKICITLSKDNINAKINMNNKAKDIRWRLLLDTNTSHKYSYADQSFSVIKRPVHDDDKMRLWKDEKWSDMPIEIETMESVVYLKDQEYVFGFFTKGENEYQVIGEKDNVLALTLFRGVSFIGRRNLMYRPGRGSGIDGYPYPTPMSNLNKKLSFDINIVIGRKLKNIIRNASEWITPKSYFQVQNINDYAWNGQTFWMSKRYLKDMPNKFSLINDEILEKEESLILTACKKAETNDDIVYRMYNSSEKKCIYKTKNSSVNLMERDAQTDDGFIAPYQIKTFRILKK